MIQIIAFMLGGVSAYQLWDEHIVLAIIAIAIAFSFGLNPEEIQEAKQTGHNPDSAATRMAFSMLILSGLFVYSFM